MGLDDYSDTSGGVDVAQPVLRKVLEIVASRRATYLGEIDNMIMEEREDIKRALYYMKEAGVLEMLPVKIKNSDPRIISRIGDMHGRGMYGIERFRQIRWYGLSTDISWQLKVAGQDFYVDEFHEPLEVEERDKPAVQHVRDLVESET